MIGHAAGAMRRDRLGRLAAPAFVGVLVAALCGCVERELRFETDPPGVTVTLDGEVVGTTPCSVEFDHYGAREVIFEKEGYTTVHLLYDVDAPLHEKFPFDFITEVIVPFEIREDHTVVMTLPPVESPDRSALLRRAYTTREDALGPGLAPGEPAEPPPAPEAPAAQPPRPRRPRR